MNCSECGSPLLLARTVFHCPCGAYLHAYCADKHILQAHRPEFEVGSVDLNGDFHPLNESKPVDQLQPFEQVEPSEEAEEQLTVAEETLEAVTDTEIAPVETEEVTPDIDTTSELPPEEDTVEQTLEDRPAD